MSEAQQPPEFRISATSTGINLGVITNRPAPVIWFITVLNVGGKPDPHRYFDISTTAENFQAITFSYDTQKTPIVIKGTVHPEFFINDAYPIPLSTFTESPTFYGGAVQRNYSIEVKIEYGDQVMYTAVRFTVEYSVESTMPLPPELVVVTKKKRNLVPALVWLGLALIILVTILILKLNHYI